MSSLGWRALAFTLGVLMAAGRPASGQCATVSLGDTPVFFPSSTQTRLLATVLKDRPADTHGPSNPLRPGQWEWRGQMLFVEEAEGPGAGVVDRDSLAVIMLWGGGNELRACKPYPTGDSLPPGRRHFFLATMRAESLWIAGRPTFDLHLGPFQDHLVRESPSGAEELREYRRFLKLLPDSAEWKADCRPAVLRIEKSFAGRLGSSPFSEYADGLRSACDESVIYHAEGLERLAWSRPTPDALREVFRQQGCVGEPRAFASAEDEAVDGNFVESAAPQWAALCTTAADWRLLVMVLESPPRVIELVRMAGIEINWSLAAAPASYFDWTSSPNFDPGRWAVPRPRRGVVVLKLDENVNHPRALAFYETPAGWVHVRVVCCRWPE
jgi:hypothetical protein